MKGIILAACVGFVCSPVLPDAQSTITHDDNLITNWSEPKCPDGWTLVLGTDQRPKCAWVLKDAEWK